MSQLLLEFLGLVLLSGPDVGGGEKDAGPALHRGLLVFGQLLYNNRADSRVSKQM